MKILHVYQKNEELIQRHVTMLTDGMQQNVDVRVADNFPTFRQMLHEIHPDIVHVHGCWQGFLLRAANRAYRSGARIVITLHGQLESWNVSHQKLQDKMGRALFEQRKTIERAYAVICLGKLEHSNFEKLEWNHRIEDIRNAVITNSITPAEMCAKTYAVYQKVIDSNTLEQMDDMSIKALHTIIKTGIMGDRRWYSKNDTIIHPESIDWRRLLIYAEHENIRNYVDYGISILGLSIPIIDTTNICAYFPEGYTRPQSIKQIIGDYQGDEIDYLIRMIRQIEKKPQLLHLIEITRELYRDTINDDRLVQALEEKDLKEATGSLMQILSEQTGLDEGYMPLPPVNNRKTRQIRQLIAYHLKI